MQREDAGKKMRIFRLFRNYPPQFCLCVCFPISISRKRGMPADTQGGTPTRSSEVGYCFPKCAASNAQKHCVLFKVSIR